MFPASSSDDPFAVESVRFLLTRLQCCRAPGCLVVVVYFSVSVSVKRERIVKSRGSKCYWRKYSANCYCRNSRDIELLRSSRITLQDSEGLPSFFLLPCLKSSIMYNLHSHHDRRGTVYPPSEALIIKAPNHYAPLIQKSTQPTGLFKRASDCTGRTGTFSRKTETEKQKAKLSEICNCELHIAHCQFALSYLPHSLLYVLV